MIRLNPAFHSSEEQANQALKEGNYHDSIQDFREAVLKNPQDFKLATDLAIALLKNQHYQESINEADHALEINPKCAQAYYIEAIAKLFLDQHQDALNAINKAIELNSEEKMLNKAEKESKAMAEVPKADKELIQKNVETTGEADAVAEMDFDDLSSPLQTRSKSVNLDPDMLDGAILFIDKKITEDPNDYMNYNSKASLLMQKRDPHAALKVCEEALHTGQKFGISQDLIARIYTKKGHCHMAIGDYDKAVLCFKRAVAHFGNDAEEAGMQPLMRAQSETISNRSKQNANKCIDIS